MSNSKLALPVASVSPSVGAMVRRAAVAHVKTSKTLTKLCLRVRAGQRGRALKGLADKPLVLTKRRWSGLIVGGAGERTPFGSTRTGRAVLRPPPRRWRRCCGRIAICVCGRRACLARAAWRGVSAVTLASNQAKFAPYAKVSSVLAPHLQLGTASAPCAESLSLH